MRGWKTRPLIKLTQNQTKNHKIIKEIMEMEDIRETLMTKIDTLNDGHE